MRLGSHLSFRAFFIGWVFAVVLGLPVLYTAELLFAVPLHRLLKHLKKQALVYYLLAGIMTSLISTWVWSEAIRFGPIPLYKNFWDTAILTVPAGAAGGAMFWRIAVQSPERGS